MIFRINNPDDGAIRRRVLALERKARFLSPTPKNQLANSGSGRIDRHHRFALRLQILVEGLNDEQLTILE